MHEIIEDTRNELVAVKVQNIFLIDESHETKIRGLETEKEQARRTSSIKCIDKISDVMGCTIPAKHP